ncbi:MAG: uroporphyrinogen decarboxylase family protein [Promethearchaeota archaeon]
MKYEKSDFLKRLSKEITKKIPLYCTGYPESGFMENYIKKYKLQSEQNKSLVLNNKNYSLIKEIGFDAISLWDFRRGTGKYELKNNKYIDSWGRIYKKNWYFWDGVLKDEKSIEEWKYLTLPSKKSLKNLGFFIKNLNHKLDPVLSLPGLFEKTWQSMGFVHFSKCLKRNDFNFIINVVDFFSSYIKKLISVLQNVGATTFLIADDCGYKRRTFISEKIWCNLFFDKYEKIIEIIHNKNQNSVIIHSDGYITNMIQVFIDLGFDAVQGLEPKSGVDIFSLFKKFKNKICFIGNIDTSDLTFNKPKQIKFYVEKLISESKKSNTSLIISPSQQIHSKVNPENVKIMIETTKLAF